jgi:hypothetical protein
VLFAVFALYGLTLLALCAKHEPVLTLHAGLPRKHARKRLAAEMLGAEFGRVGHDYSTKKVGKVSPTLFTFPYCLRGTLALQSSIESSCPIPMRKQAKANPAEKIKGTIRINQ